MDPNTNASKAWLKVHLEDFFVLIYNPCNCLHEFLRSTNSPNRVLNFVPVCQIFTLSRKYSH